MENFHTDAIDQMFGSKFLDNSFISEDYFEICRYLICMLLRKNIEGQARMWEKGDLFASKSTPSSLIDKPIAAQGDFFPIEKAVIRVEDVWTRMRSHPLMHTHVKLSWDPC